MTIKYGHESLGLGPKNHCADEGQQQFSSKSVTQADRAMYSETDPYLFEEEPHI
jgi:hypothetical protein